MSKTKSFVLWALAFSFMISVSIYQRMTGPTYPIEGEITIGGENVKYSFPTTHDGSGKDLIKIEVKNKSVGGEISYKRYKSYDSTTTRPMARKGDYLLADIPEQPPAGKVEYEISLISPDNSKILLGNKPVVIRFKGHVPLFVLIPHILFIFLAMVFSTRTALEAIFNGDKVKNQAIITLILLIIGGLILGPIVQKLAFGAFWTGWPFGHDLTDNKTLFMVIFWVIALFRLRKNPKEKLWVIIAAIVTVAVYLIPHSVLGSEIDHTKLPKK